MQRLTLNLRPGDYVEVRSPGEILQTLDSDGTLDRLPFMPEMVEFCGRRFKVAKRVVKTCYYGQGSSMRTFPQDDVVLLEGLRCSGLVHDGCQKSCTIFWRDAWLKKVEHPTGVPAVLDQEASKWLRARLKTTAAPNRYFCQASEILNATRALSHWERFTKIFSDIRAGNSGVWEMTQRITVWMFWKIRKAIFGPYARGTQKSTPAETLNLRAGEWIEIKPVADISETLNSRAYNRGLYFTPAMGGMAGEQRQVQGRIEKIIVDGTGEMRQLHNTAFLKDSYCGCSCVAFGGCPRGEFAYWRDIWLRRVQDAAADQSEIA